MSILSNHSEIEERKQTNKKTGIFVVYWKYSPMEIIIIKNIHSTQSKKVNKKSSIRDFSFHFL